MRASSAHRCSDGAHECLADGGDRPAMPRWVSALLSDSARRAARSWGCFPMWSALDHRRVRRSAPIARNRHEASGCRSSIRRGNPELMLHRGSECTSQAPPLVSIVGDGRFIASTYRVG